MTEINHIAQLYGCLDWIFTTNRHFKSLPDVSAPVKKARPMTGIFGIQRKSDSADQSKADDNDYDPSKKKYHPVTDAIWKEGQK